MADNGNALRRPLHLKELFSSKTDESVAMSVVALVSRITDADGCSTRTRSSGESLPGILAKRCI